MKKAIAVCGVICLFAIVSSLSFAGAPKGLEKKGKVPTGFSQGEKSGWKNEYPPGWDHKSEQEKQQWIDSVKNGRERILKDAKKKGMSEKEAESAADDFEKTVRRGTSIEEGESLVKENIGKGKKDKQDTQIKEKGKSSGKGKKK